MTPRESRADPPPSAKSPSGLLTIATNVTVGSGRFSFHLDVPRAQTSSHVNFFPRANEGRPPAPATHSRRFATSSRVFDEDSNVARPSSSSNYLRRVCTFRHREKERERERHQGAKLRRSAPPPSLTSSTALPGHREARSRECLLSRVGQSDARSSAEKRDGEKEHGTTTCTRHRAPVPEASDSAVCWQTPPPSRLSSSSFYGAAARCVPPRSVPPSDRSKEPMTSPVLRSPTYMSGQRPR